MSLRYLFFVIVFGYIYFDTEAFIEYARVLKQKWTNYKGYDEFTKGIQFPYHQYLLAAHNCFFVRLVTCPVCVIVWLCMTGEIFYNYDLFLQILISWVGYFGFKKVMDKLTN